MKPVAIIGIAGGTGAGKTTLAQNLYERLGGDECVTYLVHDNYYKDLSHVTIEERAGTNFDHPDSLDTDLLCKHVQLLKNGHTVHVPVYDFASHTRTEKTIETHPRKIILLEGILIFTHVELVKEFDVKVFVDADSDIRLMRRINRDTKERGRTVEQVMAQYHETVRPMHQQWVEPSKAEADLIVHSKGHSMFTAVDILANHLKHVMKEGVPKVEIEATSLVENGSSSALDYKLEHGEAM